MHGIMRKRDRSIDPILYFDEVIVRHIELLISSVGSVPLVRKYASRNRFVSLHILLY